MNILLISNMYPSKNDPGYASFIENFERSLLENDAKVNKVVIKGREKSVFKRFVKYVIFSLNCYRMIVFSEYDLIYVHYITHSLLPLIIVSKFIKKPLVINAHGGDVLVLSRLGQFIQNIVLPLIKKANCVVVPSEYFKSIVAEKFSISRKKIFISPSNGVDMDIFKPHKKIYDEKPFVIGFVSRIVEGKGWDIFLNSLGKFKIDNPSVLFQAHILGAGDQLLDMERMIDSLGLREHIKYFGPKPQKELADFYSEFDIFVFPTTFPESLGLVGIEAMASGVPVVSSNVGALPNYVENGVNGFLFPPGDSHILADKLSYYVHLSSDQRQKLRLNAIATAEKYEKKRIVDELLNRLNSLVDN